MKIHEYQAKELFRSAGIPVLNGELAISTEAARQSAERLGGNFFAVKAQVHAGGRGKGGGIKTARNPDDVERVAHDIIGMTLITPQTGADGKLVRKVYVETGCQIAREFYLALLLDGSHSEMAVIASREGGMEIEKLAFEAPEKIVQRTIDPQKGLQEKDTSWIADKLGIRDRAAAQFSDLLVRLYSFYFHYDCTLVEINPLVLTESGAFIALDAKITFDDNALARHPEILALRDKDEEDVLELKATESGLNYIRLSGTIGCMVNGAGLAMATMDIIKLYGEEPANFLDVGGGATEEAVTKAFQIITSDPNARGILVNIFGGIMKCDVIAKGIVAAASAVRPTIPLVVRLVGTNGELGRDILAKSGLPIVPAETMKEAAERIVSEIRKGSRP